MFNLDKLFNITLEYNKIKDIYTIKGMIGTIISPYKYGRDNIKLIFIKLTRTEIIFHHVFLYEVMCIFEDMLKKGGYGNNAKSLKTIINLINEEIKRQEKESDNDKYNLDLNIIYKTMKYKPLPHQKDLYTSYKEYKVKTGNRGILLDMSAGLGKTATALAVAEMLNAKHVIIISPLQVMEDAWLAEIKEKAFKDGDKRTLYTSKMKEDYNQERYILFHYEAMEELYSILSKIDNSNTVVIVDESHNFASIKSKRTSLLQDVIDRTLSKNVLLLSGTPVKSYSNEVINIVRLVDVRLDNRLYKKLFKLYSNPNKFFKVLLYKKYQSLSYKAEKKVLGLDPLVKTYLPVKLNNGEEFTLPFIKEKMKEFISKRLLEINNNLPKYENTYQQALDIAVNHGFKSVTGVTYKYYLDLIDTIKRNYEKRTLLFIPDVLKETNSIEKRIENVLPRELVKPFREAKTIIKYPLLKLQGECLGIIVLGARIKCHSAIADQLEYDKIINSTVKDTIVFSSYVNVCKVASNKIKNLGYKPAMVYGELTKYLNKEVKDFTTVDNINPLITTYKSLGTGVNMTNANVIIALDLPYRMYLFEQAVSRAWRLGQDSQVTVYIPSLDTGDVPNINQRNFDIISFFNKEVKFITGFEPTLDIEETETFNTESLFGVGNFDTVFKDYNMTNINSKLLMW